MTRARFPTNPKGLESEIGMARTSVCSLSYGPSPVPVNRPSIFSALDPSAFADFAFRDSHRSADDFLMEGDRAEHSPLEPSGCGRST